MKQRVYNVSASAAARATAGSVYGIIADYRHGHPHILPRRYFTFLEIEQGGMGAGTVINFGMRAAGRERTMRAAVEEPTPGRVLVERSLGDEGIVTTFTVEPAEQGRHCRVTISTELRARPGAAGLAERLFTSAFLRRVYAQELRLLADFAEGRARVRTAETPLLHA